MKQSHIEEGNTDETVLMKAHNQHLASDEIVLIRPAKQGANAMSEQYTITETIILPEESDYPTNLTIQTSDLSFWLACEMELWAIGHQLIRSVIAPFG